MVGVRSLKGVSVAFGVAADAGAGAPGSLSGLTSTVRQAMAATLLTVRFNLLESAAPDPVWPPRSRAFIALSRRAAGGDDAACAANHRVLVMSPCR